MTRGFFEPMLLHPAQEGFFNGEARRRTDNAVNTASRTGSCNALAAYSLVYPVIPAQAMWAEDEQAVKAAAKVAGLDLFAVVIGSGMGADMARRINLIFPPP